MLDEHWKDGDSLASQTMLSVSLMRGRIVQSC
jgi:hypothetical protein